MFENEPAFDEELMADNFDSSPTWTPMSEFNSADWAVNITIILS